MARRKVDLVENEKITHGQEPTEVKESTELHETNSEIDPQLNKVKSPQKSIQRKIQKNIDLNAMIKCKSVVVGGLTYVSPKTQAQIRWNNYGDIEYVPFGELVTMNAAKRKFLYEPWIIVEDEEVAEHFGLDKVYAKLIDLEHIDAFFHKPLSYIKAKLETVPSSMKELIADKAREMISNETLIDIRVIKLLDQELNMELQILID